MHLHIVNFKTVFSSVQDLNYNLEMSTRVYPLFQKGNPQLRIFLPNFWMKIIRPKEPIPPYMVLFQTSIEMTDHDVKNYLEKIYKVPVVEVKTSIKQGKIRRAYNKHYLVKEDDYKEALVTLPRGYQFTFPEIICAEKQKTDDQVIKDTNKQISEMTAHIKTDFDLPPWFQ